MDFKKITVCGIVQGIGFRPFVFRIAKELGLCGSVKNNSGQADILIAGDMALVDKFIQKLSGSIPPNGLIVSIEVQDVAPFESCDFVIENSDDSNDEVRLFLPDMAMCDSCGSEIYDNLDRRENHYFNSCIFCGPRFSILNNFPYDRKNTSMGGFLMCGDCQDEYSDAYDRRFHAQTISCNCCGPQLLYKNAKGSYEKARAFSEAVDDLKSGKVVAVKGIGGYHYVCEPFNESAVMALRELKKRRYKPFAVMFRNVEKIDEICHFSEVEREALLSSARPIVLCELKNNPFPENVLFESNRCGCFLPYTPLQELMLREFDCLIMTSANVSGSPIIHKDADMQNYDSVLFNKRDIIRPLEDSVVQKIGEDIQVIRRSRGYVPLPIMVKKGVNRACLAVGGDLKSTFVLAQNSNYIMSPYIGDLANCDVYELYKNTVANYIELFRITPEVIVCDNHPDYFSSAFAKEISSKIGVELLRVNHHHAHAMSVIAEHGLGGKVLGVIFDGSGYGDDGNVWGGEFLLCEETSFKRVAHLEYVKLLGGDSAAVDAKKTAMCYLRAFDIAGYDDDYREIINLALSKNINTFRSCSVGRIFDAVSSILDICHMNDYEAQCACALQYCAEKADYSGISPVEMEFDFMERDGVISIGMSDIIKKSLLNKSNKYSAALGFHDAVIKMVTKVCDIMRKNEGVNQIALSGGVFQNAFLLNKCISLLKKSGYDVYFNKSVPTNDGGISLGQAFCVTK